MSMISIRGMVASSEFPQQQTMWGKTAQIDNFFNNITDIMGSYYKSLIFEILKDSQDGFT